MAHHCSSWDSVGALSHERSLGQGECRHGDPWQTISYNRDNVTMITLVRPYIARTAMPWRIVPLMMVFVALAHFNRVSISVAGTEKIIDPDFITAQQMGLVYSAFLLLYTLLMIPGGWFIDRFGPKIGWMVVGFGSAVGCTDRCRRVDPPCADELAGRLAGGSLPDGLYQLAAAPERGQLVANWIPPSTPRRPTAC